MPKKIPEAKQAEKYLVEFGYSKKFITDFKGVTALLSFIEQSEFVTSHGYNSEARCSSLEIIPIPDDTFDIKPFPDYDALKQAQVLGIDLGEYKESLLDASNTLSD